MSQPAEEFQPELQDALAHLHGVPSRDPELAERGRAKFLAAAKSLAPVRAHSRRWLPYAQLSWASLIALLVLTLSIAGLGATVYAAQDSLPNTLLYPVKTLTEDTQLAWTLRTETRLALLLSFSDRRIDEIVALHQRGVVVPAGVSDRLNQHLDLAQLVTTETSDTELAAGLEQIAATIRRQQQMLAVFLTRSTEIPPAYLDQTQKQLGERLKIVESGLSDPVGFRLKMSESGRPIPGEQGKPLTTTPTTEESRLTSTPTVSQVYPGETPTAALIQPTATAPEAVRPSATPSLGQIHPTSTPLGPQVHPTSTQTGQVQATTTVPSGQPTHPTAGSTGQPVRPTSVPTHRP